MDQNLKLEKIHGKSFMRENGESSGVKYERLQGLPCQTWRRWSTIKRPHMERNIIVRFCFGGEEFIYCASCGTL